MATQTMERVEVSAAESSGITHLAISGMTCGNCVRHVTQAIQGIPGVRSVDVSLDSHQATVRWQGGQKPAVDAVIKAVEEEGYGAKVAESAGPGTDKMAGWQLNVWLGVPVTLVLMAGEWVFRLGTTPWFQWLAFGLAAAVQCVAGARFYRGAWSQLKAGSSNMDTLVALGSTTAFGYSTWALLSGHGGHVYFMEAAAIITLISVGHWIESRVSVRASGALRKLLNLAPAMARRRNAEAKEEEVPVSALRAADTVVLRPGDRVPTDGTVLEGRSAVDESMLTGESVPIDKTPGNELYAGTVNLNGLLAMRVTATGEQTALAHIIAAVQRAQSSRAGIQRIGDQVSSIFVPVVVFIALASALWWGLAPESARAAHGWLAQYLTFAHMPESSTATAFIIAAAVLIIACPCAMGLATPAAIMAGSNAAAQRGILIRDGVALEKAGRIEAVVFDKTGTLTAGKPAVVSVWAQESSPGQLTEAFVKRLAAALARRSSHPVSLAIAHISTEDMLLADWVEVPGSGVSARVRLDLNLDKGSQPAGETGGLPVRLGSMQWLSASGVGLASGNVFHAEWSRQGATVVGLAIGETLAGLFAVRDTLKPGAVEVISKLHHQGLKTYLVTGDNSLTAAAIARQVGIPHENVFAEVRPQQKADFIKDLQKEGHRVGFIGDGINDAPALEQADLGIAVSRASDIAREAADIILLNSEIQAVPESLGLARATLRTIKQNLFWAFFYNALGIPLAALGFMSPILCAAAMGISDLVVIGNALRLLRWKM